MISSQQNFKYIALIVWHEIAERIVPFCFFTLIFFSMKQVVSVWIDLKYSFDG